MSPRHEATLEKVFRGIFDMPTFIDAGRNNKMPTTDCCHSPLQTLVSTSDSSLISVLQYLIYEPAKLAVFHEQVLVSIFFFLLRRR